MIPASVVVASFRPLALLRECVASIAPQCAAAGAELLVVRPRADGFATADPTGRIRYIHASEDDDVPRLRGRGLHEARGEWVVLTEDHCVAEEGWLDSLLAAGQEGADVVGGGMGNARTARAVDWAAYFSEYGFFSSTRPRQDGPPILTGANVAYSRRVASEVARWASEGVWENVIHARLLQRGCRLRFVPEARVRQNGSYTVGGFCRDRYEHGRDYARDRLTEEGAHRWLRLATVPLLPFVLTSRLARTCAKESPVDFLRSLPLTLTFLGSWSVGEGVGYLKGAVESRKGRGAT